MSDPVQKKIAEAFNCLSETWIEEGSYRSTHFPEADLKELQEKYLDFAIDRDPATKIKVEEIRSCLSREADPAKCLGETPELNEGLRFRCGTLNQNSSLSIGKNRDAYHFAALSDDWLYAKPKNSEARSHAFLREIAHFHYKQRKDWLIPIRAYLRSFADQAQRLKAYDLRKVSPVSLQATSCTNALDFQRAELSVEGLAYRIPVDFVNGDRAIPWLYLDILQAQFEVLKTVLNPRDLEAVLRPGNGRPDLRIVVGEWNTEFPNVYQECKIKGDPDSSGEYHFDQNRIDLTGGPWRLEDSQRSRDGAALEAIGGHSLPKFPGTFYHEFAHALYHALLGSREHEVIRVLSERSVKKYEETGDPAFIPNPKSMYRGRPYSMQNSREFFAEMVAEYLSQKVQNQKPSEPAAKARYQLMEALFSSEGLQSSALSAKLVESVFATEKINLSLSSTKLTLPIRANFQFISIPYGEKGLQGPTFGAGLGVGFVHFLAPHGLLFGASGVFDFSMGYGNATMPDGKIETLELQTFDTGALGAIGYAFPGIELSLEPGLGWRHMNLGKEEKRDRLWLGADANVVSRKYGLGLGARVRGTTDGGYDLGVTLGLNLPKMLQFSD